MACGVPRRPLPAPHPRAVPGGAGAGERRPVLRVLRSGLPPVVPPLPARAPPHLQPQLHYHQPRLQHLHPLDAVVGYAGHLHHGVPALLAAPAVNLAGAGRPGGPLGPVHPPLLVPQPQARQRQ